MSDTAFLYDAVPKFLQEHRIGSIQPDLGIPQPEQGGRTQQEKKPIETDVLLAGQALNGDVWQVCSLWQQLQELPQKEARGRPHSPEILEASPIEELLAGGRTDGRQEWTIAVNLNFGDQATQADYIKHLQKFAKDTKGKPVTVLAQVVVPDKSAPNGARIERYLVKDGKFEKQEEKRSEGFAKDITSLVRDAAEKYPTNKLGMIHGSHGMGNQGVEGVGKLTAKELSAAIEAGLKGTGHDKLEMLDLLSCLMAQHGVLSELGKVSKNVIASEEVVYDFSKNAVQLALDQVLSDPKADGEALAKKLLERDFRTPTMAAFKMSELSKFTGALDQFGETLLQAIADPKALKVVQEIIEKIERQRLIAYPGKFDLKLFCESILKAIQSGELDDKTGKLAESAKKVAETQSQLVQSYKGDKRREHLGGLSVYLPHWLPEEVERAAKEKTALGALSLLVGETDSNQMLWELGIPELRDPRKFPDAISLKSGDPEPKLLLFNMWNSVSRLEKTTGLSQEELKKVQQLKAAIEQLTKVDIKAPEANASIKKILDGMTLICKDLSKQALFVEQLKAATKTVREEIAAEYKAEMIGQAGGWRRFREKLYQ